MPLSIDTLEVVLDGFHGPTEQVALAFGIVVLLRHVHVADFRHGALRADDVDLGLVAHRLVFGVTRGECALLVLFVESECLAAEAVAVHLLRGECAPEMSRHAVFADRHIQRVAFFLHLLRWSVKRGRRVLGKQNH
jgi:hypothetical protein